MFHHAHLFLSTQLIWKHLLRGVAWAEVVSHYEWMGQDFAWCNPLPGNNLKHFLQQFNRSAPISRLCYIFLVGEIPLNF